MIGHDWFMICHSVTLCNWFYMIDDTQAKDYKPEHFCPMGMFLAITLKTRRKSKKKSNCIRDLLHIENNERFAPHNEMKMYFWTSRECSVFFSSFKKWPDIAWPVFGCQRPKTWTRGVLRFPSEPKPNRHPAQSSKLYFFGKIFSL